jgi:dTDP-4-amino-4,6-dideoxygalactose transaminase
MSSTQNVPFLDLVTPHAELEDELLAVYRTVMSTAGFIGGPFVEGFERDFAAFCRTAHAVGLASGTDALRFALMAAGVRDGDTVATVSNTFIATTEAISQAGATPEFVDVDERTYTLDPGKLRLFLERDCTRDDATGRAISKRTGKPVTAVVPVHLYGQMADMDPILALGEEFNFVVVEDACQAHGAQYFSERNGRWCTAGEMGLAGAFSFYPGKNLGACGEAGAITTNDEELARRCRMIRDHGQSKKYFHDMEGYNGRLDALQAGFLKVKLPHLAKWNEQRRNRAHHFDELLGPALNLVGIPYVPTWSRPVFHLYVVRVADRERVQKELTAGGIGTGIHYPFPLHLSKPYAALGYRPGDLPVTERLSGEILSLPMFPTLTVDQQRRTAARLLEAAAGSIARAEQGLEATLTRA